LSEREKNADQQGEWLAERFEAHRSHLRAVAYRILGSQSEAEDAVQESWLRLSRSDTGSIENLGGWLTTVIARVCLDMLRSRESRHEELQGVHISDATMSRESEIDPEQEVLLADSVGLALLVVLDTLNPAERLAFVLHDLFAVSFDEIAPILGRSPVAVRQLASRARRRVQGAATTKEADLARQREVVDAFLAASRNGDFDALLAVLDPEVVFRADQAAAAVGSVSEVHGAPAVARFFKGRAGGAQPALVNGTVGLLVAPNGKLFLVLALTIVLGRIAEINAIADPAHIHQLDLAALEE
jgi:RNA polymerase sigma-70 factor (ECF subfamily)